MPADKPEGEAVDFLVTHWNKRIWLTYDRLFGFLLGATTSGAGMYYYVIDEYRVSNQLLTEDIYVRHSHLPSLRMFADEITIYGGRLGKRAIANENRLSNPRSNG